MDERIRAEIVKAWNESLEHEKITKGLPLVILRRVRNDQVTS